jgi:hypothetical protein
VPFLAPSSRRSGCCQGSVGRFRSNTAPLQPSFSSVLLAFTVILACFLAEALVLSDTNLPKYKCDRPICTWWTLRCQPITPAPTSYAPNDL